MVVLLPLGIAAAASPRPGSLDPTFGKDGKVRTVVGHGDSQANALVAQKDRELVAAGSSDSGLVLVRYDRYGHVDRTFGRRGKVINTRSHGANALLLQSDGKLVAGGNGAGGRYLDFDLLRFHSNGSLDGSFGRRGEVLTGFPPGGGRLEGMALQPDGKIIAVGRVRGALALVRYLANGRLDATFGARGRVTTPGSADARAIVLQPDGSILVAAYEAGGFGVLRYRRDGSLDSSYGSRGTALVAPPKPFAAGNTDVSAIAAARGGKLVLLCWGSNGSHSAFILVRLAANGSVDRSFGAGGYVITVIGPGIAFATAAAILVEPGGKLVAGGSSSDHSDFALVRYLPNGALDRSFGRGGKATTSFGKALAEGAALIRQTDGRLVLAGAVGDVTDGFDIALARYRG